MALESRLTRFLLLPELKLQRAIGSQYEGAINLFCTKNRKGEVCPKCATLSTVFYDSRKIRVKDAPLRDTVVKLHIKKQRYYCKTCRKPFTEPIAGIMPKARTTQRFKRTVRWACDTYSSMSDVRKQYRCSNGYMYKAYYEEVELRLRKKLNYAWPKVIGIDEHFFRRENGYSQFMTVFTDMKNRRLREAVLGKSGEVLKKELSDIPGRENVRYVALDMSDTYKKFAFEFFPNAELVADKFHVLRLLTPAINRRRKEITGDRRTNPLRKLLLRSRYKLRYYERNALDEWLARHPELAAVYEAKERLHTLYRTRGMDRAREAFTTFLAWLKTKPIYELQNLHRTLTRWQNEILNYFKTGLTNARTEGFNRIASLVKNRGFGYTNAKNYRLRLLNACAH
jgi:transposase